ncbi:MAG: hypothetical protein WED10_10630 [Brumimicrobium sp.]
MNRVFGILLGGAVLFLTSCGGGWNDERQTQIKNDCVSEGNYDCDCYLKTTMEVFPNPEDYNNQSDEDKTKYEEKLQACEVEVDDSDDENLESF